MSPEVLIAAGSVLYVLAAVQTSRYLVGQWKYKAYLKRGSYQNRNTTLEQWNWSDEGFATFGAVLLCVVALPIMLPMTFHSRGNGEFMVVPKVVKQEQELKEAKAKIAQLEELTGVGNDG